MSLTRTFLFIPFPFFDFELCFSIPTDVPSGCAKFSYELSYQPDSLLKEKFRNLVHSAEYDGGHFAAFEVPETLGEDIYEFVEKVERLNKAESDKDL